MDHKSARPNDTSLSQDERWEAFKSYLSESGHRITQQRRHIFDAAIDCHDHCTAEQLLGRARKTDPSVSRATVYRTLPILVKSHVMREIDVGKDYKYYTAKQEKANFQAQIVCVNCDKIFEIDAPFMEWYGKAAAEKLGMIAENQRLQVYTRCSDEHCS